jgi:hypothetical protein
MLNYINISLPSKRLILSSIALLSMVIYSGCKKTKEMPRYYFTAEIGGEKINFETQMMATRKGLNGSPDSTLLFSGTDSVLHRSISIQFYSYPYSLTAGVYHIGQNGYCLYLDSNGLGYDGPGITIIINKINSSVVQGSFNGDLIRGNPPYLLFPITASFNIPLTN